MARVSCSRSHHPRGEDSALMELRLDTKEVRPLSQSPSSDGGRLSPDGLWLAYHSNRSGRLEIYVQPYPDVNAGRWQVSMAGAAGRCGRVTAASCSSWRRTDRSWVPGCGRGHRWSTGPPVKLLEPGYWSLGRLPGRNFDVSLDGKRFLVVTAPKAREPARIDRGAALGRRAESAIAFELSAFPWISHDDRPSATHPRAVSPGAGNG